MGKLALYRHYRSQDFSELVGQDYVSKALENAVKNQIISHAYLFTGPRGVGKTSAARILARRVNELEEAIDHPDIIEIDAASNNGVEEIRELREKVHIAPNYTKYKVYIIDEVHMLSTAAFNALLKTLEEPPSHVIFVLATTEPHKLPATIISRTQHFPFQPISKQDVAAHLRKIADLEKIKIDDTAIELITELGEGSMRDSISLLDQIGSSPAKKIGIKEVESVVGLAKSQDINKLIEAVESSDRQEVIKIYDQIISGGISPQVLVKQLLISLRSQIRNRLENNQPIDIVSNLLDSLSRLPSNLVHAEFALEVLLLKAATETSSNPTNTSNSSERSDAKPDLASKEDVKKDKKPDPSPKTQNTVKNTETKKQAVDTDISPVSAKEVRENKSLDNQAWIKALSIIKVKQQSLYSLLANTDVDLGDKDCNIKVGFQFHYRRLNEPKNYGLISDALNQATGSDIKLNIVMSKRSASRKANVEPETSQEGSNDEDLDAISQVTSILGGEAV